MKTMHVGAAAPQMRLDIIRLMPSDMQAGNAERVALYHTSRWQRRRRAFLAGNPLCAACAVLGTVRAATVVDHADGHSSREWRARFWDETRWQAMCSDCHAAKSATELAQWRWQGEGAQEDG
jgi:5-methylcytosine-specific restriction protein A